MTPPITFQEAQQAVAESRHLDDAYNERWVPIAGFDEYYYVSSHGRVISFKQPHCPKILKIKYDATTGYAKCALIHLQKMHYVFVHRLVAQAFIPNDENKIQVNHKDFDRCHNHVENLEWMNPSENMNYSNQHGRFPRGSSNYRTKLTEENVIFIKIARRDKTHFCSELGRMFGVSKNTIEKISSGKSWMHLKI